MVLPPVGGNFAGRVSLLVAGYAIAIGVAAVAFLALRRTMPTELSVPAHAGATPSRRPPDAAPPS
ncbi:hypothetical protein BJY18_003615 [Amycolatopsis jiangsuensis]|uniref:Uncharacterized protein n=1 Tax=Amycolatopsis jiangsuensis TaxID=1181879 RepID=A0A840IWA6_9PSEU|nr:hypothetical protein [Amycolatopsis jiangsuensis]